MKRENWMLIFGTSMAVALLCGLCLLLAAQPTVTPAATSIALANAPVIVKLLVGLVVLVSGVLLAAPFFEAQLKSLH